jgi:hypothetical protein
MQRKNQRHPEKLIISIIECISDLATTTTKSTKTTKSSNLEYTGISHLPEPYPVSAKQKELILRRQRSSFLCDFRVFLGRIGFQTKIGFLMLAP